MSKVICATLLTVLFCSTTWAAGTSTVKYSVTGRYALGGNGGWDYLTLDPGSHHLFIARCDRVMVMDVGARFELTRKASKCSSATDHQESEIFAAIAYFNPRKL